MAGRQYTTWNASDTLTVKNIVSYAEFHESTRINFFGDNLVVPARIFGIPTGARAGVPISLTAVQPGYSGKNAAQYTITEEFQLQGRSKDERLNWQAGVYAEISNPTEPNTQLSVLQINCADVAALQCSDPIGSVLVPPLVPGGTGIAGFVSLIDQEYRFRNLAAYAQTTYALTEQLSLTGGIRYTSDRTRATSRNAQILFPLVNRVIRCSKNGAFPPTQEAIRTVCKDTIVQRSSRPTWLINFDCKPNDDILIYANYARGYRQGVINLLPLGNDLNRAGPEKRSKPTRSAQRSVSLAR